MEERISETAGAVGVATVNRRSCVPAGMPGRVDPAGTGPIPPPSKPMVTVSQYSESIRLCGRETNRYTKEAELISGPATSPGAAAGRVATSRRDRHKAPVSIFETRRFPVIFRRAAERDSHL